MSCGARPWNVPIPLWPYVMLCSLSTLPLEAVYRGSEQQHSTEPDTFNRGKIHLTPSSCFSDTVKVRTPVKDNPSPPFCFFSTSVLQPRATALLFVQLEGGRFSAGSCGAVVLKPTSSLPGHAVTWTQQQDGSLRSTGRHSCQQQFAATAIPLYLCNSAVK